MVSRNERIAERLLEPGVLDNKYYVRNVGLVREQTIQGGSDVLDLVSVTRP
jgi:hypothetical protein